MRSEGASEEVKHDMPAVDEEFLELCLQGREPLRSHKHRMAARAITDSMRSVDAHDALNNALAWIEIAYRQGRDEGIRQERERWHHRIKHLFELES